MSDKRVDVHQKWQAANQDLARLPEPDEALLEQSQQLQSRIRDAIQQQGGVISFEQYMQMALYEPGLGYYTSTQQKLGAEGDFVTAPEISPIFARCVAHFCQRALAGINAGNILEFGAGSGRMAVDILLELETRQALPSSYFILELSAELQQRQRHMFEQHAPHLLERIEWLQQLPAKGFRGIILGNELLDAMPVHRFRVESSAVMSLGVRWSASQQAFEYQAMDASPGLLDAIMNIEKTLGQAFSPGYESEVSLAQPAWLKSVGDILDEGLILLVDYGYGRPEYYLPERSMGTLMCHFRHRAHDDPFQFVGLQDITAYVDFTRIAEVGRAQGLSLSGYTTQCGFLLENGLENLMPDPETSSQQLMLAFAQQVKTLTLPSEMGERFKVMALAKACGPRLPGFTLQDQRGRL